MASCKSVQFFRVKILMSEVPKMGLKSFIPKKIFHQVTNTSQMNDYTKKYNVLPIVEMINPTSYNPTFNELKDDGFRKYREKKRNCW